MLLWLERVSFKINRKKMIAISVTIIRINFNSFLMVDWINDNVHSRIQYQVCIVQQPFINFNFGLHVNCLHLIVYHLSISYFFVFKSRAYLCACSLVSYRRITVLKLRKVATTAYGIICHFADFILHCLSPVARSFIL